MSYDQPSGGSRLRMPLPPLRQPRGHDRDRRWIVLAPRGLVLVHQLLPVVLPAEIGILEDLAQDPVEAFGERASHPHEWRRADGVRLEVALHDLEVGLLGTLEARPE